MSILRQISSFDSLNVVSETFSSRRLDPKDFIWPRLISESQDEALARLILHHLEDAEKFKSRLKTKVEKKMRRKKKKYDYLVAECYYDIDNSVIDHVDISGYQSSDGRTIRIKLTSTPKNVVVFVNILSEEGEVEKGWAVPSETEPGWWIYKARIRRPAIEEITVNVLVGDDASVFGDAIFGG